MYDIFETYILIPIVVLSTIIILLTMASIQYDPSVELINSDKQVIVAKSIDTGTLTVDTSKQENNTISNQNTEKEEKQYKCLVMLFIVLSFPFLMTGTITWILDSGSRNRIKRQKKEKKREKRLKEESSTLKLNKKYKMDNIFKVLEERKR